MSKTAVIGTRPPSYVSKATLAAELDMSESTVNSYVKRGVLPKPIQWDCGSVRWCWADISAALTSLASGDEDKFMEGVANV